MRDFLKPISLMGDRAKQSSKIGLWTKKRFAICAVITKKHLGTSLSAYFIDKIFVLCYNCVKLLGLKLGLEVD